MTSAEPHEGLSAYLVRAEAAERRQAARLAGALRYYTKQLAALTTTQNGA